MTTLLIFVLGLCFGSLISAVSYRYPKRIPFTTGRSFCPKCKHQISWYDNIPLLSFILLGGKCRNCKKPISWRYPAIELATAFGFVGIFYFATTLQGASFKGVVDLIYLLSILCILEIIFVIDLEHQIIPDAFIFLGVVLVLFYTIFYIQNTTYSSPLAGFLAASLLLLIHLFTRGKGMGLGDVKFAVLGGLLAGLRLTGIWLFAAFLTGAIVGTILILARRAGLKDKIAFGPFLIIGLFITLLWGERILGLLLLNY